MTSDLGSDSGSGSGSATDTDTATGSVTDAVTDGGAGAGALDPTLSHTRGETTPPLLETTIGDDFDATVARFGDREALVDVAAGRRWTYTELQSDVDRLARGLLAIGVGTGDRVGIWAPNCSEWVLVQYATAKIGAILVNINPSYRSHELRYVLQQAGVSTLVTAESFKTSDYRGMVQEVRAEVPDLTRVVHLGTSEWDDVLARADEVSESELAGIQSGLSNTDPINIQYTSGTTGFPKGATLSHRNILGNGFFVGELCRYTEADRVCIPVPFYHCFGMVMGNLACTTHGACIVIPAPGFDPAATLRATQDERCTSLYGVPTMFIAEWNLPDFDTYDLSSVRTGIMAGSPCPAEMMKKLIAAGIEEMTICYGMTETSPVSLQNRTDDTFEQKVGTVGRVGPHLEVKVVDPVTGDTLPRGTAGELCTKGYSVMLGYWEQPEKTAEVLVDGWMHTGDIGVMHDDGYVEVTGRIKDMVIRGGENIYPREVEEFLYTHPDIVDAQVIGVPDERYGEELCVWVRMREGSTPLDADAVRAFCSGKLAHYKIPRYVEVVDEFPMTVTGKVRKVEMREVTAARLGLA
ncbi:fatty-acyl-CoA synthase [Terracoccus luteus]|uniref:Fatty-acyl-CoA synthase n=1 Tax=Terracoccus luteus TaxID=53356 RepID=A0A495Y2N7_9MICO|nr:AMP-binding protein [Terracoccus luteus]RKT79183.1 fatty-acyl-CoA synthase [Terracoccus luteus]